MKPIQIKGSTRQIGMGLPSFLIAEVGINHNGDFAIACQCIKAAARAGADAVKFQNYRAEDFVPNKSLTYTYQRNGQAFTESQYDMFKRYEMPEKWIPGLKRECDEAGVVFLSTPTCKAGVDALMDAGAPLLKNGSDFLQHLPLIRYMGASGVPLILSTGMATCEEISDAVSAFEEGGGKELVLLVCTSSYPTAPDQVHLNRMGSMRQRFGVLSGFSDHTEGAAAASAAVACGAVVVEKHFTLDKAMEGPDHWFSSDVEEFTSLVKKVREMEVLLGSPELGPASVEKAGRQDFRLSCVASRDLPEGSRLGEPDIAYCRPGLGIPPKRAGELVGCVLRKEVKAGEMLLPEDCVHE